MTDAQAERLRAIMEREAALRHVSVREIPPGSLVVASENWLEVVEPEPTGLMTWDMGLMVTRRPA